APSSGRQLRPGIVRMTAHSAACAGNVGWYSGEVLDEPPGRPGSVVGRQAQLARLAAFIDAVPTRGQVLVAHGDAGMGKTMLLANAADRARSAGMRVLWAT